MERTAFISLVVEVVSMRYMELQLLWKAERLWEQRSGDLPFVMSALENCIGFEQTEKGYCDQQVFTVCQLLSLPAHLEIQ